MTNVFNTSNSSFNSGCLFDFVYCLTRLFMSFMYSDTILLYITSILVTRFALASLPQFEATVNSVLYGFWRAWQLTRYLAKALSRCVCWFHHTSLNNFYDSFDITKSPLSPSFSDQVFIDLPKEELQTNHKPLSTFSAWTRSSQHCFMTVVVTSYRRGALVTPTLTKVPKMQGSRALA